MIQQLQEIFGEKIQEQPYEFPGNTPVYIRDGYKARRLTMAGSSCIVVTPTVPDLHLPALKKQYDNIRKMLDEPIVLDLQYLSSGQRKNLIENNIPFLSLPYQIYLPFWGCMFMNRFVSPSESKTVMSAAAQLVFLHLLYRGKECSVTHKEICDELGLSKSGGTRAIQTLNDLGLIDQKPDGTSKRITLTADSSEKASGFLRSPIQRVLYLRSVPENIPFLYGGIKALSMRSMIAAEDQDGCIVFSRNAARMLPKDLMTDADDFSNLGGIAAEVWSYDPFLLSSGNTVDEISLLLTLQDNKDERVQKELDPIRIKYGLYS